MSLKIAAVVLTVWALAGAAMLWCAGPNGAEATDPPCHYKTPTPKPTKTPTPTSTPIVHTVVVTATPSPTVATQTPVVVEVTSTFTATPSTTSVPNDTPTPIVVVVERTVIVRVIETGGITSDISPPNTGGLGLKRTPCR